MVVAAEEHRHHILLTGAHLVAIVVDALSHHVEVETVGQRVAVGLVYTLVEIVGRLPDFLYLSGIFLLIRLELFLCHICEFLAKVQKKWGEADNSVIKRY